MTQACGRGKAGLGGVQGYWQAARAHGGSGLRCAGARAKQASATVGVARLGPGTGAALTAGARLGEAE